MGRIGAAQTRSLYLSSTYDQRTLIFLIQSLETDYTQAHVLSNKGYVSELT